MPCRSFRVAIVSACLLITSCGVIPDGPLPEERDRGLIIFYGGASSVPLEESFWFVGLRLAGIDQAIEGVVWGVAFDNYNNAVMLERAREFARREAQRLAEYMDAYPGRPITLMGYSAGALVTALVAEEMPPGKPLSRIILISPDASPHYDLSKALDGTRFGAVSFWSPIDDAITALTLQIGTLDGYIGVPAAMEGFTDDDPRLIQVSWIPEMILTGHLGKHFDYIFNPLWIAKYVSPWIPE